MNKFSVGEIAIATNGCRGKGTKECEIIKVLGRGTSYFIVVPGCPAPKGKKWQILERNLRKKKPDDDNKDLTTWKHVQDTCEGFIPDSLKQEVQSHE